MKKSYHWKKILQKSYAYQYLKGKFLYDKEWKSPPLRQLKDESFIDLSTSDSQRRIGYFTLQNSIFCGRNLHYPNLLFQTSNKLVSPYDERVMSLAAHKGIYPLYIRVKIDKEEHPYNGCIGEIESYNEDGLYKLKLSKEGVAGFSQDFVFDLVVLHEKYLNALDTGLNSPYLCDMDRFKQTFSN